MIALVLLSALAHPDVDAHLHATETMAPCDEPTRMRRAASLSEAERFDEAEAELNLLCHPQADPAVLARARLELRRGAHAAAWSLAAPLAGLDAAVVSASALSALGRNPEAGHRLGTALRKQPSAVPDHYLDAARWLDDAEAVEVLDLGIVALGPVSALVRAAASRQAATGDWRAAIARLQPERLADVVLRGDLLRQAGRNDEARVAYQAALQLAHAARQTRAIQAQRETIERRLEAM